MNDYWIFLAGYMVVLGGLGYLMIGPSGGLGGATLGFIIGDEVGRRA